MLSEEFINCEFYTLLMVYSKARSTGHLKQHMIKYRSQKLSSIPPVKKDYTGHLQIYFNYELLYEMDGDKAIVDMY